MPACWGIRSSMFVTFPWLLHKAVGNNNIHAWHGRSNVPCQVQRSTSISARSEGCDVMALQSKPCMADFLSCHGRLRRTAKHWPINTRLWKMIFSLAALI